MPAQPLPQRIVALEEHVSFPDMVERIPLAARQQAGWPSNANPHSPVREQASQLAEIGAERLRLMDEAGISVQVLSVSGPGAELLGPTEGPAFAQEYNDRLAAAIARHPGRFFGFAHLPMTNPVAAAEELARTVGTHQFRGAMLNGTTQGLFLDDPKFAPLLARAEALGVPLYLHPGVPPAPVRAAYYSNLPHELGERLSMAGFGWHAETAIHVLRLILSGTLETYPRLRFIIGHMGETLPVMMARADLTMPADQTQLPRSISQTLRDQVFITTSGIFTRPPLEAALATFGLDNILFSVDYPYAPNKPGHELLAGLQLPPADIAKLAYRNADQLLGLA
ncbi:amidohydrolase family protein [Hymenobacter cheonanensis]|uniref:amidohydrolase family protein n=1 Tax=Hymenobacter sp. CA2-7 TaxID=3063993 RepID=UPI002712E0ED|nr:amidohydrolase family protein [Hymenobacter sp. CA2-7]MDO7886856.1 amidohydrolase family protein [Hymenobacter sp. CA2-7]